MRPRVISAFAGLGKTTIGNKYNNICDLQSSLYRYDYSYIEEKDYEKMKYNKSRIKNTNWPNNYLCAIKKAMKKYDLVLVPSNLDVRELLYKNKIEFLFILPAYDYRETLLERYKNRGNTPVMINNVMNDFNSLSRNQNDYNYPIIIINKDQYLEDLFKILGYLK